VGFEGSRTTPHPRRSPSGAGYLRAVLREVPQPLPQNRDRERTVRITKRTHLQNITMNATTPVSPVPVTQQLTAAPSIPSEGLNLTQLSQILQAELEAELEKPNSLSPRVADRIAREVSRICDKSTRIQTSGEVNNWLLTLGRHRIKKCMHYYHLGSRRGRVELHSNLSTMVYRHIAPHKTPMGFQGRHALIEDFLQGFYIEVLKVFRRENEMAADYTPRTRLELAEYMAFSEQYAKRRINLPGHANQQIIILRAQNFARRQPQETLVDLEVAMESPRREEMEGSSRSPLLKQVREQMVADALDPTEGVLRDRVLGELMTYLQEQGHQDCVDYLVLRLQDLPAPEIDEILGLTARQRDYLQQRFKYHVEKFARIHQWELVHHWLGADLSQNLGLSASQWQTFLSRLTGPKQELLRMKQAQASQSKNTPISDKEIARRLKCSPKQFQKRWYQILEMASKVRNEAAKV